MREALQLVLQVPDASVLPSAAADLEPAHELRLRAPQVDGALPGGLHPFGDEGDQEPRQPAVGDAAGDKKA
jgi:hypothetical protein